MKIDQAQTAPVTGRSEDERIRRDSGALLVTVVTSEVPPRLTKSFHLSDGKLTKVGGGILAEGEAYVEEIVGLGGLARLLVSLGPAQALVYGLPPRNSVRLVTKATWERSGHSPNVIPRTASEFSWPTGPGVLMLDYDPEPGGNVLRREELVDQLRSAVPGLSQAGMLWFPSASSHIFNVQTGEDLTGLRGQRLYLLVRDAADIPRAGQAIVDACWLAGYGYFKVSKSGSLLARTLFDASVWQTNRLDFAAGASCEWPLEQRRGEPILIPGTVELVDTQSAVPDFDELQVRKLETTRQEARAIKEPEASAAKAAWIAARAAYIARGNANALPAAEDVARRAVEHAMLFADFPIIVIRNGHEETASVGDILRHPNHFDGLITLDPIEPDYDDRRPVGKLFLGGGHGRLFSFAHGGQFYKLHRQLFEVEVLKGKTRDTVDATLEVLRDLPDVFDLGGALVEVDRGRTYSLDAAGVAHLLGGVIQYFRWQKARGEGLEKSPVDPPLPVIRQLLALIERRRLKPLKAVITAPTIRPDGTVLARVGYDRQTELYLDGGCLDPTLVIENPSTGDVKSALDQILKPFEEFPFVTSIDRGVFLAALLTAVVRPVLPTSPGFGFDAPVQGSGKTLLANCVAALATGEAAGVFPHAGGNDDEEIRKRIFAALLQGRRAMVWDNVTGTFDSPSVAAVLTSMECADRILGRSETISVPNRLLFLMTGNNLCLVGDMARRVLTCRIDPRIDRPYAREFNVDPFAYVLNHRQEMVAAAITILRGWLTSTVPRAGGRMASFELWDDVVRQAVIWVSKEIWPGYFDDPMNAVDLAQSADPDNEVLTELLAALHEIFGTEYFTANKVLSAVMHHRHSPGGSGPDGRLADCLREYSDKALSSARSIGRVLKYRVDRIAGGKRLETIRDPHSKVNRLRVVTID